MQAREKIAAITSTEELLAHAMAIEMEAAERRAVAFFTGVEAQTDDEAVAAMARRLAEDERKHVSLREDWLDELPEPDEDWADDPDPPLGTE